MAKKVRCKLGYKKHEGKCVKRITEIDFNNIANNLEKSIDIVERISKIGTLQEKRHANSIIANFGIQNWQIKDNRMY